MIFHPPILTGFAIVGSHILEKPILPETMIEVGPILNVPYATPLSEKLSEQFDDVSEYYMTGSIS
ncbi:hypothetical protein [Diplocloster hominis]|uniref:hypothetical protein n=1 Tax=Diplocloster hominis TaxID=3079010 RepID=UPI0031BA01EF